MPQNDFLKKMATSLTNTRVILENSSKEYKRTSPQLSLTMVGAAYVVGALAKAYEDCIVPEADSVDDRGMVNGTIGTRPE